MKHHFDRSLGDQSQSDPDRSIGWSSAGDDDFRGEENKVRIMLNSIEEAFYNENQPNKLSSAINEDCAAWRRNNKQLRLIGHRVTVRGFLRFWLYLLKFLAHF